MKCERTDHLDEEISINEDGCQRVKLGFESGSDKILKDIQKDETTDDMIKGRIIKEEYHLQIIWRISKRNRRGLEKNNRTWKKLKELLCFINIISLLWYKNVL